MLTFPPQENSKCIVSLVLVSCLAITSCATPGNDPSLSPA
jgi:hypothetical protein